MWDAAVQMCGQPTGIPNSNPPQTSLLKTNAHPKDVHALSAGIAMLGKYPYRSGWYDQPCQARVLAVHSSVLTPSHVCIISV